MGDTPKPFGRRKEILVNPEPEPAPQQQPSPKAHISPGDKIIRLLRTPYDRRDGKWGYEFVQEIQGAFFKELYSEILSLEAHRAYGVQVLTKDEPGAMKFSNLVKKAVKSGRCIALFTEKGMEPDFVFKHGQLTPFFSDGKLMPLSTRPFGASGEVHIPEGTSYIMANPSPKVLPEQTRAALRDWLDRRFLIQDATVTLRMDLISEDEVMKTLGVDFGGHFIPEENIREIMLGIYWYLPPDIAAGQFPDMNKKDFFPL